MTDVARTVPTEVPVGAGADLLPARRVDLSRAVKIGLLAGLTGAFLAAIGLIASVQRLLIVGRLRFGYTVLLAVGFGFGYLAARPPQQLEGFEAARPGPRNLLAGLLAGVAAAVVLVVFIAIFWNFSLREIFTNMSREVLLQLVFGRSAVAGSMLLSIAAVGTSVFGAFLHLVPPRIRKPVVAGTLWIVVFGLVQPFFAQLTRGTLNLLDAVSPRFDENVINKLLYETGGGLKVSGAIILGLAFTALYAWLGRSHVPLRARFEGLPEAQRRKTSIVILAALVLVLAALPHVLGPFLSQVLNIAGIFLLMALGLNIVVGFAGLLDLGYVAFFAVGAYVTAVVTSPLSPRWAPELIFWEAIPFVILAAAVAGLIVGTPVLRMRGDYLAIVTLGFGEIARLLFLSDWLTPYVGGAQGIIRIPNIEMFGFVVQGPQAFFYAIFGFALVAAYVSYALQDSRIGRAWMAMREDESVAEAMGVNIVTAKLSAFIIGAILAGFGGALFASNIGSIFPHSFRIIVSITVLVVIIVGGLASVPGVVVGALALIALPELLREFETFRFLIYGALLIFMMIRRPEGFIPSRRRAQELHEDEVSQDAWLRAQAEASGEAGTQGA